MKRVLQIGATVLAGIGFAVTPAHAVDNPTIASTSLCGDAYLQAFAPEHIAALSWQSRSPLSQANKAQKTLPQMWDDAEVIAASDTDFILFGAGEGMMAERLGKTSLALTWGEDFASVETNVRNLAERTGINSIAIEDWQNRLDKLKQRGTARQSNPKVLYLSRSGGSAGTGTFIDAAIKAAGGVNAIETAGWITPDPEKIISLTPDLIITSFFTNGYESVQSNGVRHKIIRDFIAARPRVEIDGALWPCAGPGLLDAAELIADALDKLP